MKIINVVKRDGSREELNLEKIHKVVGWACEGLTGVSISEIELRARLQIDNGTTTTTIHDTLIRSAADLISENTPNYQYVAARLVNYQLRKEVYGGNTPYSVKELVDKNVALGVYTRELLDNFDDDDWNKIDKIVKHNRDDLLAYAGMEQWRGKYLIKNRVTNKYYETPQVALVLISALGFMNYPKDIRMSYIKDFYDAVSTFDISLPTPIMGGLRGNEKQFSSCTTLSIDDSLESIAAGTHAIMRYISQKAGLGIDMSRIRSAGSEVAGGTKEHTGLIPFVRLMQSATKSLSQGGIRGGSATIHFVGWHYEFEDLVVLKNNKGTEFNRVRQMDYSFLFNRLMYQRLIEGGDITFFTPKDVPGLLDAFYTDQDEFDRLYVKYENTPSIRKKKMKALDFFTMFITERKETGRIYLMNVDHANSHGTFIPEKAPITQSNLCQEITLPTIPLQSIDDPESLISLCTLGALNWGKVKTPDDFEKPADLIVRFLDEILSYQEYPVNAAKIATDMYRPLGVGIINLAYFLAKNNLKYDDNALETVDQFMEGMAYYLTKASIELAKEKGACESVENTKYSLGIVPIDTRKLEVDELLPHIERYDWDTIRDDLKLHGIRNSTLMAFMPAETSAQLSNSTNGVEPIRAYVTEKVSKNGNLKQVAPDSIKLKNKYDMLWDQKTPRGYLKVMAILNKYSCQSGSFNTSYNPNHYPDGEIGIKEMITDLLLAYKWGIRNLYYFNTCDDVTNNDDETTDDVLLDIDDDEECSSCVL